jgi:hypothetical protein
MMNYYVHMIETQIKSGAQIAIDNAMAKFKAAKRIAVENFVLSAGDNHMHNHMNLSMDAKMYKWNGATVSAIKKALRELGK